MWVSLIIQMSSTGLLRCIASSVLPQELQRNSLREVKAPRECYCGSSSSLLVTRTSEGGGGAATWSLLPDAACAQPNSQIPRPPSPTPTSQSRACGCGATPVTGTANTRVLRVPWYAAGVRGRLGQLCHLYRGAGVPPLRGFPATGARHHSQPVRSRGILVQYIELFPQ